MERRAETGTGVVGFGVVGRDAGLEGSPAHGAHEGVELAGQYWGLTGLRVRHLAGGDSGDEPGSVDGRDRKIWGGD